MLLQMYRDLMEGENFLKLIFIPEAKENGGR